jgi:hypothetical protein
VASINLSKVIQEATEKAMEDRKEEIYQLLEKAWYAGYDACREGEQRHNPYRKANPDAAT